MKLEDVQPGMTVRVGPNPSVTAVPYVEGLSDPHTYVVPDCAGQLAEVISLAPYPQYRGTGAVLVHVQRPGTDRPLEQSIHPAHLSPWTAEAAASTVPTFEEIVSGPELDDLHDLGDQLDTLAGGAVALGDHPTVQRDVVEATDLATYVDDDGDGLATVFQQFDCDEHGYTAFVLVQVNDEAVRMPIQVAMRMAAWIAQQGKRVRDEEAK